MLTVIAHEVNFFVGTASVFFFWNDGWRFKVWFRCVVFLLFCNMTVAESGEAHTILLMSTCTKTAIRLWTNQVVPSSSSPSASFSVVSSSAVSSC